MPRAVNIVGLARKRPSGRLGGGASKEWAEDE
jgi:hypothetical protein